MGILKTVATGFTIVAVTAGCAGAQPKTAVAISPELAKKMADLGQNPDNINSGAQKFIDAYGCSADAIVINSAQIENNPDKPNEDIMEQAQRGTINLELQTILDTAKGDGVLSGPMIEQTVFHATGHACKAPDVLLNPSEQFSVPDGQGKVIGFSGLSLIIQLPDGTTTKFTKIEEEVIEALRKLQYKKAYISTGNAYNSGADLFMAIMARYSNSSQINYFLDTSDVEGLAATILGKNIKDVTTDDIISIMNYAQWAWDRSKTTDEIMAEIKLARNAK
jgi:hypothetical protein